MKLLFQSKAEGGVHLSVVECTSTEEADQFLAWFNARAAGGQPVPQAEPVADQKAPPVPTGVVPRPAKKITRADMTQAGMQLLQTKGRSAVEPILAMFGAKRLSEIAEDKVTEAYYALKDEL